MTSTCAEIYKKYFSRSDFYTFVYLRALGKGVNNGGNKIPFDKSKTIFYYGKQDNGMTYNKDTN
jgi:hypothetical protein